MKLPLNSSVGITIGIFLLAAAGCSSTSKNASLEQGRNPGSADRSTAADRATNPAPLNSTDRDFAMKAAQGGMAEVELGNLAQQRGASEQIKEFGKRLVDDHTKLNNDLKDIAAKQGISLPTDLGPNQRQAVDKMAKLSGAQFDREFWSHAVKDHREDISELRNEADKGENPALKDFAASSISKLEDHLRMAQNKGAK